MVSADLAQRPPPGGFLLPDHTWHWLEILPDILLMRYLLPLLQDAAEGRLPARELDLDRAAAWLIWPGPVVGRGPGTRPPATPCCWNCWAG